MALTRPSNGILDITGGGGGGTSSDDFIHVMDYALNFPIWDGVQRPLSGIFGTLGEAQAVYPFVTSLTQELAWAATQAAVLKAEERTYGGTVILPAGRLRFGSGTVRVSKSYVSIKNASELTRIDKSGTTGYTFLFRAETNMKLFWVGIQGVYIVSESAMSSDGCIHFHQCSDIVIERIRMANGYINLRLTSCQNVHMNNVTGTHGLLYAVTPAHSNLYWDTDVAATSPTNGGWMNNCNFRSQDTDLAYSTYSILITSADGIWMSQVHTGNTLSGNVVCSPKTGSTQLSGVTMNNCWHDQGGEGRMIWCTGTTTAAYGWMQISDCYLTGGPLNTAGIVISPTAGTFKHLEITGGKIHNLLNAGISIARTHGFLINGVQIRGTCRSGAGAGIEIAGTCDKFSVTNNNIGYNMGLDGNVGNYGVSIGAGANNFIVTGNNLRGNAVGAIADATGAVSKVIGNNLL